MRLRSSLFAFASVVVACGGNVVVDPSASPQPATGGSSTTSTGTSTTAPTSSTTSSGVGGSTPVACTGTQSCSGTASSCGCSLACNGSTLSTSCSFSLAEYACTCLVDGNVVGSCSTQALSCDVQQGCCASFLGQ
jgi:hypothetical protein